MKKLVTLLLMAVFVFALTSCGRHIAQQRSTNQSTTYLCPMHMMYISSQPGKCPKCGMELVSFDDFRNSKSGNPKQNIAPDIHNGTGGSGGGHAGHH